MATQVRGNNMIGVAQRQGDPIPITGMISSPMDEEQGGPGVPPVHVVEFQTLGIIACDVGPTTCSAMRASSHTLLPTPGR